MFLFDWRQGVVSEDSRIYLILSVLSLVGLVVCSFSSEDVELSYAAYFPLTA